MRTSIKLAIFFLFFSLLLSHCSDNCTEGSMRCDSNYREVCSCSYDYDTNKEDNAIDSENCYWNTIGDCENKTCIEAGYNTICE
jgi:hypothetical protein